MSTIIKIVFTIVCLISLVGCDPEGWSPTGDDRNASFDMGIYSYPGGVSKNDKFSITVGMSSYDEPLEHVVFKVTLPHELKLLDGKLLWKGNIAPNTKQRFPLRLHSKTDWKEWSAPVNIHVEFLYKGEKIVGDKNWSYADEQAKRFNAIWKKNGKEIRND